MTYSKREEIFSKEFLTIRDIQDLYGLGYDDAAKMIRDIKKWCECKGSTPRLTIQGKLHTQDYFDYFGITNYERYMPVSRSIVEEKSNKEVSKV